MIEAVKVFVNYRQRDSRRGLLPHAPVAEALAVHLAGLLGPGAVYFDTTLPPGEPYPDVLRARIAEAAVLVVVIHPGWLEDLRAREGTRKDWVREEIAAAARADKVIVPVLLEGAELPRHDELHPDLHALADAQAVPLRFGAFDAGLAALAAEVELRVAPDEPDAVPPSAPLPDRGRLTAALVAAVVLLLLGTVATFAGNASSLFGVDDPALFIAAFAILPGLPLFAVLGVAATAHALRRPALWLDELLGRVTEHKSYAVFGTGVAVVSLAVLPLAVVSAGGASAELVAITLVVSVGVLGLMGVLWARAQDQRVQWPHHRVQPVASSVRVELAELHRRLHGTDERWRRPLRLSSRRTARLVLGWLDGLLAELGARQERGRIGWWRTRNPYLTVAHAGPAAAAVLVPTTALVVHWSEVGAEPVSGLWWALGVAGVLGCYAGTLEIAYRTQRWHVRSVLRSAPPRVAELRRRLAELSTPIPHSGHRARTEDAEAR